ncbi:hypothetical protein [Romboutsia lituseburensis]|uniref:hypothetical protein n=1 Tax=Romboutsia lituseburensis TaxID=1537 RepID=UPI00215AB7AD|nr:hypothetical protein [Romboutsia lituseburensis]MCR8744357.1 hypothetical protein [Romboutsia lituseburensis]
MKIKIGDIVTIKNKKYLSNEYPRWIREAIEQDIHLKVIKPIPMKGLLVRSMLGDKYIFNRSDLRAI